MKTKSINSLKDKNIIRREHLKYRKVSLPRFKDFDRLVENPFAEKFRKRIFKNDIYFTMKPAFVVWVYIKNLLLANIPAFVIHAILNFLSFMNKIVLGEDVSLATSAGGLQLLILAYGICTMLGIRKIKDHMAYFNNTMLVSKHDINRKLVTMIWREIERGDNIEIDVMDHYRLKFMKLSLFPTTRELALEEQLYSTNQKSKHEVVRQGAEMRYNRLSLDNRREEHIAAKHIADWKQDEYGGPNEYDLLVRKYRHRVAPVIRDIIKDLEESTI
ncbi:hypothetical protein NST38_30755 [Paenibacillus sp. FSL H8-0104]|uniref:hypothetical protein n=1 Tax=Paenibacillus sp. FSL H8-0104 TaxID=2954509 RepID=UPI0030FD2AB7